MCFLSWLALQYLLLKNEYRGIKWLCVANREREGKGERSERNKWVGLNPVPGIGGRPVVA